MIDDAEHGFDPEALLEALLEAGVEFIVIGGIAAAFYGSARVTQDLDIIPAPGYENARRLATVLSAIGARPKGVDGDRLGISPTDADDLYAGGNWQIATRLGDLDVLPALADDASWADLFARARKLKLRGGQAPVIGKDDLIRLKQRAGRRQDIDDIVQITSGAWRGQQPQTVTVQITALVAASSSANDAVDAAHTATASWEDDVTITTVHQAEIGEDQLIIDAALDGFTAAHAQTWANIVTAKLAQHIQPDPQITSV